MHNNSQQNRKKRKLGKINAGTTPEDKKKMLWYLASTKKWTELNEMLDNGEISAEHFEYAPSGSASIALLTADAREWDLLNRMLDLNLITPTQLESTGYTTKYGLMNVALRLGICNKWVLFKKILGLNLMTPTQLDTSIACGVNTLFLVALSKQWDALNEMLNQNLITRQQTGRIINRGSKFEGGTTSLILAIYEQDNILNRMLDLNLITTSQVESAFAREIITRNNFINEHHKLCSIKGVSLPLILSIHKQWGPLNKIIDKGLITSPLLGRAFASGDGEGENTVLSLASQQRWNELEKMLHLLTASHLESSYRLGPNMGNSTIYYLIRHGNNLLLSRIISIVLKNRIPETIFSHIHRGIESIKQQPHQHIHWDSETPDSTLSLGLHLSLIIKPNLYYYPQNIRRFCNAYAVKNKTRDFKLIFLHLFGREVLQMKPIPSLLLPEHNHKAYSGFAVTLRDIPEVCKLNVLDYLYENGREFVERNKDILEEYLRLRNNLSLRIYMDEIITQYAKATDKFSVRSQLKDLKPDFIDDFLKAIQRHQSQQMNNPQLEAEAEVEAKTQHRTYLFSTAAQAQITKDVCQKLDNGDNIRPGGWDNIIGNAVTL